MNHFNESFYTDDFDQEMLDYIWENYSVSDIQYEWASSDTYLKYSPALGYFWTCYCENTNSVKLTKQQFKEKIGMAQKQFSKSDLKKRKWDGVRLHHRNSRISRKLMGDVLGSRDFSLFTRFKLCEIEDDLTHFNQSEWDIMKVIDRDGTVLFERKPEKVTLTLEVTPEQAEQIKKQLGE
ncbi:MAG: hypothetical protein GOVbin4162_124 [Prokaryotic dsDNA virus sp.]|nr:MAG: hypothetical protein GOVbin4162_124 [Prokaryotic dsDNA virus sp.]|tara:strand:- start:2061 stop:2600 length:540 start_codon:yes stop_codon:yes gene_type:complete